ncbi:glycosyltransferase family 2 protein [Marininema halotolerans]|uniref:Dolichol-phosphate mannosyltransferase n=1 Tax=Marininema halotolerans TaxID=1155944 RepID=A0A1I6SID8_9BACL|nr:glycosyltransferase family 2 protein [Marininema halotolerans]SFS76683.1 dolichol-phosphate mannosyltransferase [Marininema halotolerans]
MSNDVRFSVVIPVFNEEAVLEESYRRLKEVMESTGDTYELLFVDDGSKDRSATLLRELRGQDPQVKWLRFSRNFGHQVAITAGMEHAKGEAVVVIDADLQDPPELILEMIQKWEEGFDVVYAKRKERKGESWFKRVTAAGYYRLLRGLTEVDIPLDTGDFRLLDRKVCHAMNALKEKHRFVRGMVSWVGFRQTAVEYVRDERWAGETKYPLKKMLGLSMDGITSFSYKPLRLASYVGFLLSMGSFLYMMFIVLKALLMETGVPGWASLATMSLFFHGVTLIILGLMGEYIGRIYDESKNRPLYLIDREGGVTGNVSPGESDVEA